MRKAPIAIVAFELVTLLSAGGCAVRRTGLSDLPAEPMVGHFTGGAKGESWFRPCGAPAADKSWWVAFGGRSVAQFDEKRAAGLLAAGHRIAIGTSR